MKVIHLDILTNMLIKLIICSYLPWRSLKCKGLLRYGPILRVWNCSGNKTKIYNNVREQSILVWNRMQA